MENLITDIISVHDLHILTPAISFVVALFALGHMCVMEFYTDIFYRKIKILKRRMALKTLTFARRHLAEGFTVYFTVFLLPSYVIASIAKSRIKELDMSINPLHIVLNTWFVYLCFDLPYFFVHKAFHEVPFLFRNIHRRHHDEIGTNIYITAKSHIAENIIAVTPFLTLWAWIVLQVMPTLNLCTLLLPALDLIMYFNIGHSGFDNSLLLDITRPLSFVIPFMTYANRRHEQHHVNFKQNYGPALPFLDTLFGSNYIPSDSLFRTSDQLESEASSKSS